MTAPDDGLERRLHDALGGHRTALDPSPAARRELVVALHRRRNRRRTALASAAALVLVAGLALSLGLRSSGGPSHLAAGVPSTVRHLPAATPTFGRSSHSPGSDGSAQLAPAVPTTATAPAPAAAPARTAQGAATPPAAGFEVRVDGGPEVPTVVGVPVGARVGQTVTVTTPPGASADESRCFVWSVPVLNPPSPGTKRVLHRTGESADHAGGSSSATFLAKNPGTATITSRARVRPSCSTPPPGPLEVEFIVTP